MNLSDMLSYADIEQLSKIANVYECECSSNSKNELIQSILSTVSRTDVFEARVNEMKLEDLRFINSLLFETREAFSLEDLIARVQHSRFDKETITELPAKDSKAKSGRKKAQAEKPYSPRETIAKFKQQGWLFNGISGSNRYLFQMPNDLKSRFQDTLRRKFAERLHYSDDPQLYRDEQGLLQEDIVHLLRYVRDHEVQLAADGSMYKRFVQQVIEQLGVREELPAKGVWRFGYGRHFNHYPNRFSLLYDYTHHVKYISESNNVLCLTAAGEERLCTVPVNEWEQLYRFWVRVYKGPITHLPSIIHWVDALAERWVTVSSLHEVLVPFIKPYYYDNAATIFEQRILMMMVHLGMLRIGEHSGSGTVARMTKAGRAIVAGVKLTT